MQLARLFPLLALVLAGASRPAHASPAPTAIEHAQASTLVDLALEAMGGRARLMGLHSAKLDIRTVSYRIEDSERADGP